MNAPQPHSPNIVGDIPPQRDDDEINLAAYLDILLDSKWLIATVTAIALLVGLAYALFSKPIYEADLLLQVEDGAGSSAQSLLGDASNLFDVKTPASGEIEILRSRMVVGRAVEETKYYIDAKPLYVPIIGQWLASRAASLSDPGFLGFDGYVSGTEKIVVPQFEVPRTLEGSTFVLTAGDDGKYQIDNDSIERPIVGTIGQLLNLKTREGNFVVLVSELQGKTGAQFALTRSSRNNSVDELQSSLQPAEKGRQSGIINVTMQGRDRDRLVTILNEIGQQYVKQNIERKAAEAQKTLAFLDTQLPQIKQQLDKSEQAYNQFRKQNGTIALDEETRLALQQTVELQTKLFESEQQRRELQTRFTGNHPALQTLNSQISAWQNQINQLNGRIKGMPILQQDSLRLQRDLQVNNELYQSLLNNSMQLRLVKEGKVGNVRLLDEAVMPLGPVKPRKALIVGLALVLGLIAGVVLAIARNAFFKGIRSSEEIETRTGLNVYSTIPMSAIQKNLAQSVASKAPGIHLLSESHPNEPAVESLRSLRTSLQFAMLEAPNNRVLITGPTPGVGKSFVSANFATVLAAGGKRTLLIDADMRKGYLNQFFGLRRETGLSDLIAGNIELDESIRVNVLPGLDLIPTGTLPPNPAELLMSDSFIRILDKVSAQYDIVIIDTPPVLVAADTAAMARSVGIVLLVARAEETHIGEINESTKRLLQAGRTVNGIIFNGVDVSRRYNGRYGYGNGSYRYAQYNYAPDSKSK